MRQTILKAVEARLDVPGLVEDVLRDAVNPALDQLVASTATPLDDMVKAALYGQLEGLINAKVKELWAKVDGE